MTLGAGGGAVQVDNAGTTLTLSGSISGPTGLTKTGAGGLTLSNSANSFAGNVTVGGGTLTLPSVANAGVNSVLGAGSGVTLNGGVLEYAGSDAAPSTNRTVTLGAGGGTIAVDQPATGLTLSTAVSGAGSLSKNGPGTLVLPVNNTYAGTTTVNGGTLQIGTGGNTGTLGSGSATINSAGTLVFSRNDNSTIGNSLAGSGAIVFQGTGVINQSQFVPTGANSGFSGAIFIGGGRLDDNGATTGDAVFGNPATVITTGSGGQVWATQTATYHEQLVLNGQGWLESAGQLGALRLQGNANWAGSVALGSNAAVGVYTNAAGAVSGPISGPYALTTVSGGTLTLSGSNTYGGGTTVASGYVVLNTAAGTSIPGNITNGGWIFIGNANQQFGPSSTLTVPAAPGNSGVLELDGNSQTLAGLSTLGTTGYIENAQLQSPGGNSSVLTIDTLNATDSFTYSGYIRDFAGSNGTLTTLGITKTGPGMQTFAGVGIIYSGPTAISGGTLQLADTPNFASNIADNATLWFNNQNTHTYGLTISGTGAVVKSGNGLLVLGGTNGYSGNTTVTAGVLRANDGAGLPSGPSSGNLTLNGGVWESGADITRTLGSGGGQLQLTGGTSGFSASGGPINVNVNGGSQLVWGSTPGFSPAALVLGAATANNTLTLQNSIDLNTSGSPQTIVVSGGTANVPGPIVNSGSGAGLNISGPGRLVLGGTAANTYGGATTVGAGSTNPALPDLVLAKSSGALAIPGNLNLTGGPVAGTYVIVELGGDQQIPPTATVTFSGSTTNTLKLMGHTQTLGALVNSMTTGGAVIENSEGDSNIPNGTLIVNNPSACTWNGYIRDSANSTSGGVISLVKSGSAPLTLSGGGITYSGSTNVTNGQLVLFNAGAFQSPTTINPGTRITWSGNTNVGNVPAAATTTIASGGTLENTNPANWTVLEGPVTVSGATTINHFANTATANGVGFYLDGGLQGSGTCTINTLNPGSGVNFRNNSSSFSGTLVVNGTAATTPFGGSGIAVNGCTTGLKNADIVLNGAMELSTAGIGWADPGSNQFTMGALSGSGAVMASTGAATITLGYNSDNGAFSGLIANGAGGPVSLVKTGAGTQILTGSNTYAGTTTINGGTLQLGDGTAGHDGSLNTSLLTNNSALVYNLYGSQTLNYQINGAGKTYLTGGTLATATTGPGLFEGLISNGSGTDTADAIPHTSIQPVARWGTSTVNSNPVPGGDTSNVYPCWGNNSTWGYSGCLLNKSTSAVTYEFGKNFDDNGYLVIDGTSVISNTTYSQNVLGSITLSPGLHTVDLRFGQGGGLVGPNTGAYNNYGISYNTTGNTATTGTWLQMGAGDTNTQFYALAPGAPNSSLVMSASTTLDLSAGSMGGTLLGSLADASGSPAGQQVLLGNNTLFTGLDNTNTIFSGVISGNGGGLSKQGSGAFTLLGASVYTGTTSVYGGTLSIGSGGSGASIGDTSGVVLANNSTLAFNHADTVAFAAPVSGNGSLTHAGSGMLTLSSTNTYSGGTTVSGGTLQLGSPLALGSGGLTANNGTLDLNGFNLTTGGNNALPYLSGAAGIVTNLSGSNSTLTVNQASNTTFGGSLLDGPSAHLALIKTGSGTLDLTGTSSMNSQANVNAGVLQVDGVLTVNTLNINNAAQLAGGGTIQTTGDNLYYQGSAASTFAGAIVGGQGLEIVSAGTLTLSGSANSYSGGTSIDASSGRIVLAALGALPAGTAAAVNGTLDLGSFNALTDALGGNGTVGNLSGSGGNTLTIGSNGGTSTFSGTIQDPAGPLALYKTGSGTFTLAGSSTYAGGTTMNNGVLVLANGTNGSALGSGTLTLNGGTLAAGPAGGSVAGLVQAGSAAHTIAPGAALASGFGTLNLNGGLATNGYTTLAFNLALSNSTGANSLPIYAGDLINLGGSGLSGSGTISIANLTTTPADYRLFSGTFGNYSNLVLPRLAGDTVSLSSTADSGFLDMVVASAATFSGSATWVSNGSSLLWSNSGNWADGTGLHGVPGTAGRPADTATFSNSSSASITLDVNPSLAALTFSGTNNFTISGSGSLTLSNSGTGTAGVTVMGGSQSIASAVEISGGSLAIALSNSGVLAISGNISDDGGQRSLTLAGDGSGQLVLGGTSNSYGGGTYIEQGTLIASTNAAVPDGTSMTVGGGGVFIFDPTVSAQPQAVSPASQAAAVPEAGTMVLVLAALWSAVIYYRFSFRPKAFGGRWT